MNTLNIMIRLPGSGKTTWAKNFQKENEKTKQRRKSYLLNKDNVVGSILRNYGRKH